MAGEKGGVANGFVVDKATGELRRETVKEKPKVELDAKLSEKSQADGGRANKKTTPPPPPPPPPPPVDRSVAGENLHLDLDVSDSIFHMPES